MGKGKVTSDVFGGRKSLDTTWRTPEWILERVRALFKGPIPFDPSTGVDNPTRALRYCAGPPGTLFAEATTLRCVTCAARPTCERCSDGHRLYHVLGEGLDVSEACRPNPQPAGTPRCEGCCEVGCVPPDRCPSCWLMRQNGLEVSWLAHGPFYVNPPFGKAWTVKLGDEVAQGARGVALLPANRFEESWLHRVLSAASCVCYVDGTPFQQALKSKKRVAFISSKDGKPIDKNPFATQILGFGFMPDEWCEAMEPLGPCYAQARISRKIEELAPTPLGRKADVGAATDVIATNLQGRLARGFHQDAIEAAEKAWRENPDELREIHAAVEAAQPTLRPWADRSNDAPYHPIVNPLGANVDAFGGSDYP